MTGPGGSDTETKNDYISVSSSSPPPTANFTGSPTSVNTGDTVTFTNLSSGNITSYSWNFGSGASPATASDSGPHGVSYSTTGGKTISLTVSGPGGSDTETKANYITVSAPGGGGQINANFTPSRTSGVAPLAVFFDTTGFFTNAEFHDLYYTWDFGDPGSGTWAPAAKSEQSKNQATSGVAAHVFENFGTYTVTLTVKDQAGNTDTISKAITVQDPNVVFSGTETRCVSTSGNFNGCPQGAGQVTNNSFASEIAWAGNNGNVGRRVLFRRGDTFSGSSVEINDPGPGIIGAYGTCSNPDERGICTNAPQINFFGSGIKFGDDQAADWRVMDLYFQGPLSESSKDGIVVEGWIQGYQLLISTMKMRYFRDGIHLNFPNPGVEDKHRDIGIFNNDVQDASRYGVWMGAKQGALMGNTITTQGNLGVHNIRLHHLRRFVLGQNIIGKAAHVNAHAIKLHNCESPLFNPGNPCEDGQYIIIADNLILPASAWTVAIGPESSGGFSPSDPNPEWIGNVIVERNVFDYGESDDPSPTQVGLMVWSYDTTVRNNIFDATNAGVSYDVDSIRFDQRSFGSPQPTGGTAYNNIMYRNNGDADLVSPWSDTIVKNNIVYAPAGSASIGASDPSNFNGNPQWVNPNAGDFHLQAGSPVIDAGDSVPVFDDFDGDPRPQGAGWDIGADEF